MKVIVKKPFKLVIGSHTRNHSGTGTIEVTTGDILAFDCESDNGNVWFYTVNNQRGKVNCGSLNNLVNSGNVAIDKT